MELSVSSQHEQQCNHPLTWAWTIRCQPSTASRVFSAELHHLSPFQQAPFLCPTMHTRRRTGAPSEVNSTFIFPWREKWRNGWVSQEWPVMLPARGSLLGDGKTHTQSALCSCCLDQLQGSWSRVAQSLPGLHCALRIMYRLCFHTQTCPPYSSSVLANWFFSCPKFVLPWPSVKKKSCFHNPYI